MWDRQIFGPHSEYIAESNILTVWAEKKSLLYFVQSNIQQGNFIIYVMNIHFPWRFNLGIQMMFKSPDFYADNLHMEIWWWLAWVCKAQHLIINHKALECTLSNIPPPVFFLPIFRQNIILKKIKFRMESEQSQDPKLRGGLQEFLLEIVDHCPCIPS